MRKNILLGLLLQVNLFMSQQVGINTNLPNATLHIEGNKNIVDKTSDAIIIPRVTSLNNIDNKNVGLLVFLEKEKTAPDKENRGFYWWTGSKWQPFISTVQTSINRTITYVRADVEFSNKKNFTDKSTTDITRNIPFVKNTLKTYTPEFFEVTTDGKLKVKRKGYYNINAVVALFKDDKVPAARDMFELNVLINDKATSYKNNNFDLIGNQTFAFGGNIGILIPIIGGIKLDVNDIISLQLVRRYVDTSTPAGNATYKLSTTAESSITLQYLGDF